MYSWFENDRDTCSKIVDWQFKVIDYVIDQLKDVPHGIPIIFTKKIFMITCVLNVKLSVLLAVELFGLYLIC